MTIPHWLQRVRAGEPFQMIDHEFLEATFTAKKKLRAYLAAADEGFEPMQVALAELFGKVGREVVVLPPLTIDVGFNIEIGDRSFINANATLLDTYPIHIGRDVMIGPNCAFYPVGHPAKADERFRRDAAGIPVGGTTMGRSITIEDEVWLGGNVTILPGVTVGTRTTIGAGSVVTKSIPPDVFAAGNPCKVIRPL